MEEDLVAFTADPHLGGADMVRGKEVKGLVAFTFDDGPDPDTTPTVIDALERYQVPATFFIVTKRFAGRHAEQVRAILRRQLDAGFTIASHSVTHTKLRGASTKKLAAEIDQSIRTLATEAARPIGMFRAPFGAIDARGRAWLKMRRLTEARWSIDPRDWQAKDARRLRKQLVQTIIAQDGGIVLMHDAKAITARVVADVLDDLEAENCRRLATDRTPIWPVSIHYFLRDKSHPRAIPAEIEKATQAYRLALPVRCTTRWMLFL